MTQVEKALQEYSRKYPIWKRSIEQLRILVKTKKDLNELLNDYWNGIPRDFPESVKNFRITKIRQSEMHYDEFIELYKQDKIKAIYTHLFQIPLPPRNAHFVIQKIEETIKSGDSMENFFNLHKLNPSVTLDNFIYGRHSEKRRIKGNLSFQKCLESNSEYLRVNEGVMVNFVKNSVNSFGSTINNQDLKGYSFNSRNNHKENSVIMQRLVRDSTMAKKIREKYNQCQLCQVRLKKANGEYITEAHHIRPYSEKHMGDDNIRNLIVLCPNCHSQFDYLYYAINPQTMKIHCIDENDEKHLAQLYFVDGHQLGKEYLEYTWNRFVSKKI